jgi:uncharacterized protein
VASPFLVPVARLLRGDSRAVEVDFVAPLDAAHEFAPRGAAESDVPPGADVDVEVSLEGFSGGIRVRGHVAAPWRGVCRRCSAPVSGTLDVSVNERYVDHPPPEDEEAYPLSGEFVDLLPLARDAVLLELPIAPLCRPDCRGLCANCGADLNEGPCACSSE